MWRADPGRAELVLVLRVDDHDPFEAEHRRDDWEKAELSSYHGGTLSDEIAALLALALDIRLEAGGITRTFEPSGDPRGVPHEFSPTRRLQPAPLCKGPSLPSPPALQDHEGLARGFDP